MARNRDDGKPSVTERIHSRSAGLSRKAMPDGGHAFTGSLANQALKAVGARAMTMDGDIFMADGAEQSEDFWAEYAHERHHQENSGGADTGDHNHAGDAEELGARAMERLMRQALRSGMDPGEALRTVRNTAPPNGEQSEKLLKTVLRDDGEGEDRPDPMVGYWAMRGEGYSHRAIMRKLTEHTVKGILSKREEDAMRRGETD